MKGLNSFMEKLEKYKDQKWLTEAIKTRTAQNIADEFGVTSANIFYYLNKYELSSPRPAGLGMKKYFTEEERKQAKRNNINNYNDRTFKGTKSKFVRYSKENNVKYESLKKELKFNNDQMAEFLLSFYIKNSKKG